MPIIPQLQTIVTSKLIEEIKPNIATYIVGDFNVNMMDKSYYPADDLANIMDSFGFQLTNMKYPTRSKNPLDHIYTDDATKKLTIYKDLSDHNLLFMQLGKSHKSTHNKREQKSIQKNQLPRPQ